MPARAPMSVSSWGKIPGDGNRRALPQSPHHHNATWPTHHSRAAGTRRLASYSSPGFQRRLDLRWDFRRLDARRFSIIARVGRRRFLRGVGGRAALATKSHNRSIQARLLSSCERCVPDWKTNSSCWVRRRPARRRSRWRAAKVNPSMMRTATRSSALVLTLLTACPPGPLERENENRRAARAAYTPSASSTPCGGCCWSADSGLCSKPEGREDGSSACVMPIAIRVESVGVRGAVDLPIPRPDVHPSDSRPRLFIGMNPRQRHSEQPAGPIR